MGSVKTLVGCTVPSGDCAMEPDPADGVTGPEKGPDMFGTEKTGAGGIWTRKSDDFCAKGGCVPLNGAFN